MALTFNKKHPSTDIKEGELIFTATDANDAAINYQVAALKVANITDPVAIVFDPRPSLNPSKKWFFKTKEYLVQLGASAEIAGKFADASEVGALDNTVVANIFGASSVLFTGESATALGETNITSVTKITDTSGSSDSGSGNGSGSGSGSSNNPGTANASTDSTTKKILGMAWYWAAGIGAVIVVGGVYVAKKLFGGKKKKPIDK